MGLSRRSNPRFVCSVGALSLSVPFRRPGSDTLAERLATVFDRSLSLLRRAPRTIAFLSSYQREL